MTDLAIVTGGAHRLGRAFSKQLVSLGYDLLLHYFSSEAAAHQARLELSSDSAKVTLAQADLSTPRGVDSLYKQVDDILNDENISLKVLVNSAAVMPRGDAKTLSLQDWKIAQNLNLRAPFLCSQQAYMRMKHGSLIVNISDVGASKAWSKFPSYTVSKAALESLTEVMARSFAPRVRVNAIAPGLVLSSDNLHPEEWDKLIKRLPLKRTASLYEIASTLKFLLENEYVTGQTIVVDGGYSLV
jgi:NAD(P)-dependent dehydrogenase (short-subunit alcohol dehydrogenase family)